MDDNHAPWDGFLPIKYDRYELPVVGSINQVSHNFQNKMSLECHSEAVSIRFGSIPATKVHIAFECLK